MSGPYDRRYGTRHDATGPGADGLPQAGRDVAHDNRKHDLLDWATYNSDVLARHDLAATGTTGRLLADALGLESPRYLSGPMGGDQQIGAAIAEGRVDLVVFF